MNNITSNMDFKVRVLTVYKEWVKVKHNYIIIIIM